MEVRSGIGFSLLILTFAATSFAHCPNGWTSAGFHCYKAFDGLKSWKDAESHCQSFGVKDNEAHLVSVSDIPENVLLKTWFESTEGSDADPWIGLEPVDEEIEDNMWSDGSHAALDVFVEEGILEPEFLSSHETCLVLNTEKGTWQPTDCDEPQPYVCKVNACPDGWISYGGRCYRAFPAKKSWVYAEKHCQSYSKYGGNAHLVSVADNLENRFLTTMLEDIPQPFWIGMKGVNNEGVASWADDKRFDLAAVEQTSGDKKTKNNTCVGMQVDDGIVWEDAVCKDRRSYVCKLSHCRRGYTAIDGSCMWYTFKSPVKQSHPLPKHSKGRRRVRRAFRSFNFNRRFNFNPKPLNTAMQPKPTTNTNTKTSSNANQKKFGSTFGTSSKKTFTTKKFGSFGTRKFGSFGTKTFGSKSFTLGNQPKKSSTKSAPAKPMLKSDLPALKPAQQLSKTSATSDDSMRCMGRKWTPMGNECTQYVPLPSTYDQAKEKCESFVYTGDDKIPSRGRLKEAVEVFKKNPMRMTTYTCVMNKVRKLKLI